MKPWAQNNGCKRNGGFTLVEAMVALVLVAVAMGSLLYTIAYVQTTQQVTDDTAMAVNAARSQIEEMRGQDFPTLYSLYKAGGITGNGFAVEGLPAQKGDVDGLAGKITLYIDETATEPSVGLPMDLNGDGASTTNDTSSGYTLLPAKISINWTGAGGDRSYELVYIFGQ